MFTTTRTTLTSATPPTNGNPFVKGKRGEGGVEGERAGGRGGGREGGSVGGEQGECRGEGRGERNFTPR